METNQDTTRPVLLLNEKDNVAVARAPIAAGTEVVANGQKVTARENITPGHKIALKPIAENAIITKYGESIGKATREIAPGEWTHTHNVAPDFSGKDYEYATRAPVTEYFSPDEAGTFMGYAREKSEVGARHYIAGIATSNCSSHFAMWGARALRDISPE